MANILSHKKKRLKKKVFSKVKGPQDSSKPLYPLFCCFSFVYDTMPKFTIPPLLYQLMTIVFGDI